MQNLSSLQVRQKQAKSVLGAWQYGMFYSTSRAKTVHCHMYCRHVTYSKDGQMLRALVELRAFWPAIFHIKGGATPAQHTKAPVSQMLDLEQATSYRCYCNL